MRIQDGPRAAGQYHSNPVAEPVVFHWLILYESSHPVYATEYPSCAAGTPESVTSHVVFS